jgi:hypothetical protein
MLKRAIRATATTRFGTTSQRNYRATMDAPSNPEAGPSTPPPVLRAYDKWHKKNGPPIGTQFGGRVLAEGQDVMDFNAW